MHHLSKRSKIPNEQGGILPFPKFGSQFPPLNVFYLSTYIEMEAEDEGSTSPRVLGLSARDGLTEAVRELNLSSVSNTLITNPSNTCSDCDINYENCTSQVVSRTSLTDDAKQLPNDANATKLESPSPLQVSKRKRGNDIAPIITKQSILSKRILLIPRRSNSVTFDLQNNAATNPDGLTWSPSSSNASSPAASDTEPVPNMEEADQNPNEMIVESTVEVRTTPSNAGVGMSNQPSRPRSNALTEQTQTQDPDDQYQVITKAEPLWLLMKKHRAYEQRAKLRSSLLNNLLVNDITPMWALRRHYEPRPQYIVFSPAMLELSQKHAREVTHLAYSELLTKAAEEKERADEFEEITKQI